MNQFYIKNIIKVFPMDNPWYYIEVPNDIIVATKDRALRGLVPITVTCGNTTWDTSILPMGKGKKFIALKKEVRNTENLSIGKEIEITFILRKPIYKK